MHVLLREIWQLLKVHTAFFLSTAELSVIFGERFGNPGGRLDGPATGGHAEHSWSWIRRCYAGCQDWIFLSKIEQ